MQNNVVTIDEALSALDLETTVPLHRWEIDLAVSHPLWQRFRRTLKGLTTRDKLSKLREWLDQHDYDNDSTIQVMNYVNALKRGGLIK